MKFTTIVLFLVIAALTGYSQQAAFFDAAQSYNRLLLEKGNGTYLRISNYKVIGTPYLFGGKNIGDLYGKGEFAENMQLSYDTYNNEVEFYSRGNSGEPLVKTVENIDSFILKPDAINSISKDLKFISSELLGAPDKGFYQLMYEGVFQLYKKYKSTLEIVTTNIVESDLRQFELGYDYYYVNKSTGAIKKIRYSYNGLKKEFAPIKDISSLINNNKLSGNRDIVINTIFAFINRPK